MAGAHPSLSDKKPWVPHSFAFCAKGWETTVIIMGIPRHHTRFLDYADRFTIRCARNDSGWGANATYCRALDRNSRACPELAEGFFDYADRFTIRFAEMTENVHL